MPFFKNFHFSLKNKHLTPLKIAIIYPAAHPAVLKSVTVFKDRLVKAIPPTLFFDHYDGENNQQLSRTQLTHIASNHYDLALSLGTQCSIDAQRCFESHQIRTPLVFCGADHEAVQHLTAPLGNEKRAITGVSLVNSQKQFGEKIELLLKLKPTLRSALIVYNTASAWLNEVAQEYAKSMELLNIAVTVLPIENSYEMATQIKNLALPTAELLLVLRNSLFSTDVEELSIFCAEKKITLVASDLESVNFGAAVGLGPDEQEFGQLCAEKAIKILNGSLAEEVPISVVNPSYKLRVSREFAKQQDLNISQELAFLMSNGELV